VASTLNTKHKKTVEKLKNNQVNKKIKLKFKMNENISISLMACKIAITNKLDFKKQTKEKTKETC